MKAIHIGPRFEPIVDRFPKAFNPENPRPLKIGISTDMAATGIPGNEITHFLGYWCRSWQYFQAMTEGGERVDLQGNPAGMVTDAEREFAIATLPLKLKQDEERRQARKQQAKQQQQAKVVKPTAPPDPKAPAPAPSHNPYPRPRMTPEGNSKVKVIVKKGKALDPASPWAVLEQLKVSSNG
jgi:ProP effector